VREQDGQFSFNFLPPLLLSSLSSSPTSQEAEVHVAFTLPGVAYLYIKTIERAHSPAKMWEKVKLSNNYAKAIQQVRSLPCLLPILLSFSGLKPFSISVLTFSLSSCSSSPSV